MPLLYLLPSSPLKAPSLSRTEPPSFLSFFCLQDENFVQAWRTLIFSLNSSILSEPHFSCLFAGCNYINLAGLLEEPSIQQACYSSDYFH